TLPFEPFLVLQEKRCAADVRAEDQRLAVFRNRGNRVERLLRRLISVCQQAEQGFDVQLQRTRRLAGTAVEGNAKAIAKLPGGHIALADQHLKILVIGLRTLRRDAGWRK